MEIDRENSEIVFRNPSNSFFAEHLQIGLFGRIMEISQPKNCNQNCNRPNLKKAKIG